MNLVKRKASPYNIFMKEELARVKKEDDKITHKEAFKVAASRWKAHKAKTESK